MTLENIIAIVVAVAPAFAAIVGCVASVFKNKKTAKEIIDSFDNVRKEVMDTKQYEDLKAQLKLAYQENYNLKKKINELLTKIDHIRRSKEE